MLSSNAGGHGRIGWRAGLGAGLVLSTILIWIPQPVYGAVGDFVLTQWRTLLTGLGLLGLAGIASSIAVTRRRPPQDAGSDDESKPLLREIPGWAIWVGMAGLVMVGLLATWWLVTAYGSGDAKTIDQNRVKLEAIKLAGSVVVGTGGVAALLLAARRQRVSELDLLQRDRVAEANRHDADERRATELYTAAAEQLASDKAPVRMAGMYALSRLGETNENLRQTIINLLCAYLRMPDISVGENTSAPNTGPLEDTPRSLANSQHAIVVDLAPAPLAALTSLAPDIPAQQQQERQVRLTAERLLSQHLQPRRGENGEPTNPTFWPDMDIDLAGASLHEWNFVGAEARAANFHHAHFHNVALFGRAHFHDYAIFGKAQFHNRARFDGASFHKAVWFDEAKFHGRADFDGAIFHKFAWFNEARFQLAAEFGNAHFHGTAWFRETQFRDTVKFSNVHFYSSAQFRAAQFHGIAKFPDSHFHDVAWFNEARFHITALFERTQFHDMAWVGGASFHKPPNFVQVWVRLDPETRGKSIWPTGWNINEIGSKDGQEGRWGKLSHSHSGSSTANEEPAD